MTNAKQVLIPLAFVIFLLSVIGLFMQKYPKYNFFVTKTAQIQNQEKLVTIQNKNITVELANSESLREKGLGGRSQLEENSGMLFVFDTKPVIASFWMKDMLMPIDMIWIKNGKITKIDKNVPFYPPDTPDNQLDIYSPTDSIDYVLEVNSGFSDKNNFKVGNIVILPLGL